MVVSAHDGLAAVAGALADGAARLDGVVEELQGADGGVHGAEEEGQNRAAAGGHQLLVLFDSEDGVFLGAVVEVVGHAGDIPGHGAAHGDAHRLARRALRPRAHPQPQGHCHQGAQHPLLPPPPPCPPPPAAAPRVPAAEGRGAALPPGAWLQSSRGSRRADSHGHRGTAFIPVARVTWGRSRSLGSPAPPGGGGCACMCAFCCAGTVTSPPPRLIPRRHHCVSRPPLQLRFSFHLCHKFLQVEGGRGGGKETKPHGSAPGAGRGKATVGTAASSRGTELYTARFLKGEETFCGLEGAPAAVPDVSRGLQNSLHEFGSDGERREAHGRTDGVVAVARFARDRGNGGGRAETGAGGGAAVRLVCGQSARRPALPAALPHQSHLHTSGIRGFRLSPKLFFIFISLVLHGYATLARRSGGAKGLPHPSQPTCVPPCTERPPGPFFPVGNAAPQSLRDPLR